MLRFLLLVMLLLLLLLNFRLVSSAEEAPESDGDETRLISLLLLLKLLYKFARKCDDMKSFGRIFGWVLEGGMFC